jgi:hypothetical protein
VSKHTSGPWVITCYRDRRFCGLPWLVVARAENTVTKEIIRPRAERPGITPQPARLTGQWPSAIES